jgi:hypothetical protein
MYLHELNCLRRVVISVKLQLRVLVRLKEGENGIASAWHVILVSEKIRVRRDEITEVPHPSSTTVIGPACGTGYVKTSIGMSSGCDYILTLSSAAATSSGNSV